MVRDGTSRLFFALLIMVGMVSILAGCAIPDFALLPCDVQAAEFIEEAEGMFDEWDDAMQLAGSTPRVTLPNVIADLQAIKRNADDLEAPGCAMETKQVFVGMMEEGINALLLFVAQEPETAVNQAFEEYRGRQAEFVRRFALLTAGDDPNASTVTPLPTSTPRPTSTQGPTHTPRPTNTPRSTNTPRPTPTPVRHTVVDGQEVGLPHVFVINRGGDLPDVEVVTVPGGTVADCRLPKGIEVTAVEALLLGTVGYVRIEGSECDGWLRTYQVDLIE